MEGILGWLIHPGLIPRVGSSRCKTQGLFIQVLYPRLVHPGVKLGVGLRIETGLLLNLFIFIIK